MRTARSPLGVGVLAADVDVVAAMLPVTLKALPSMSPCGVCGCAPGCACSQSAVSSDGVQCDACGKASAAIAPTSTPLAMILTGSFRFMVPTILRLFGAAGAPPVFRLETAR